MQKKILICNMLFLAFGTLCCCNIYNAKPCKGCYCGCMPGSESQLGAKYWSHGMTISGGDVTMKLGDLLGKR